MVKYGVEKHGFPDEKKFLLSPDRKYFPENEKRSFPSEKKVYGCPIENTFSKIKNVVFLARKGL